MKPRYLALLFSCLEAVYFILMSAEGLKESANWTYVTSRKPLNTSIISVKYDTNSLIECGSICTWSTMLEVAPSFYFEQDHGRCNCNNDTDVIQTEDEQDKPEVTYGILQLDEQVEDTLGYKSDCNDYVNDTSIRNTFFSSKIRPSRESPILDVVCRIEQTVGWTLMQVRKGGNEINFTRNWTDYVNGFGDIYGDYWIGLERLHQLTKHSSRLRIQIGVETGNKPASIWPQYSYFTIGNAASNYVLSVSGFDKHYSGDSLSSHNGLPFSAPFGDNGCANACAGGWWYGSGDDCGQANLNRMADEQGSKKCPPWATYQEKFHYNQTGRIPKSDMYISRS